MVCPIPFKRQTNTYTNIRNYVYFMGHTKMSDRKKEAKPFSWSFFIFSVLPALEFHTNQPPADKIVIFIGIFIFFASRFL